MTGRSECIRFECLEEMIRKYAGKVTYMGRKLSEYFMEGAEVRYYVPHPDGINLCEVGKAWVYIRLPMTDLSLKKFLMLMGESVLADFREDVLRECCEE